MINVTSIDVSGRLPESLDLALASLLSPHLGTSLTGASAAALRKSIKTLVPPDYESEWATFNYLYFSANFLKTNLAARSSVSLLPQRRLKVLDLGCGGGSSTAGFVAGLLQAGFGICQVAAVDSSRTQLDVFRAVTYPWLQSRNDDVQVDLIDADMVAFAERDPRTFDIVLVSYSLRELMADAQAELRRHLLRRSLDQGSLVVIVESDPQGRGVELEFVGRGRSLAPYDTVTFHCPALENLGINVPPKFSKPRLSDIFDQYIKCWRSHDLELLESLFVENCRYEINGEKILVGIDSLRTYWTHNAARQRNVEVTYSTLSVSRDHILIEWKAAFDRIDTKDRRFLSGIMSLELIQDRISTLREYYVQRKEIDPVQ